MKSERPQRMTIALFFLGLSIAGYSILSKTSFSPTLEVTRQFFTPTGSSASDRPSQMQEVDQEVAKESSHQAISQIRDAFFALSLTEPNQKSRSGLGQLAAGLKSADEEVRGSSGALVQSLLIDVAHGQIKVDPSYQNDLVALFSLFKSSATNQIKNMRAAFPNSPALSYLEKI